MSSNRQELDPVPSPTASGPAANNPAIIRDPVGPEGLAQKRVDDADIAARIDQLVRDVGGQPGTFDSDLVHELVASGLKLIPDGRHTGELKLITAAVKELRYAFRVFGKYPEPHKITIFGSARTPKDHPDYAATVEFSKLMADSGWMVITGAGGGIMEAGLVGPGREKSFGVAIRLPFEQTTNEVIAGDSKLITFRYFFTRKLMFISQAEAVALFPGGFGTMDEAFELLTLVQTGKASMVPIVLCQGKGETFWDEWLTFIKGGLLKRKWISEEDVHLFHICRSAEEARDHVLRFYSVYHSSRYVRDDLVIRLRRPLANADVQRLASTYARLIKSGTMVQRGPLEQENDNLHLPRLVFTHTRREFGLVRKLIDDINECPQA